MVAVRWKSCAFYFFRVLNSNGDKTAYGFSSEGKYIIHLDGVPTTPGTFRNADDTSASFTSTLWYIIVQVPVDGVLVQTNTPADVFGDFSFLFQATRAVRTKAIPITTTSTQPSAVPNRTVLTISTTIRASTITIITARWKYVQGAVVK